MFTLKKRFPGANTIFSSNRNKTFAIPAQWTLLTPSNTPLDRKVDWPDVRHEVKPADVGGGWKDAGDQVAPQGVGHPKVCGTCLTASCSLHFQWEGREVVTATSSYFSSMYFCQIIQQKSEQLDSTFSVSTVSLRVAYATVWKSGNGQKVPI